MIMIVAVFSAFFWHTDHADMTDYRIKKAPQNYIQ